MSEPKHGVGAAVAEGLKGEVVGAPAAEFSAAGGVQAPLPGLGEDVGGPAEAASPLGAQLRRGPGRPPGASNRMTKDIRKLILAQHRHPLLALAEIYSCDVLELARVLDCKPLEALNVQVRAMAELAPYLAAKQAAVDDDGKAVLPVLQLNFGAAPPAAVEASDGRGALSILDIAQAVDLTRISEQASDASHDEASHDEAQVIDVEGESDD